MEERRARSRENLNRSRDSSIASSLKQIPGKLRKRDYSRGSSVQSYGSGGYTKNSGIPKGGSRDGGSRKQHIPPKSKGEKKSSFNLYDASPPGFRSEETLDMASNVDTVDIDQRLETLERYLASAQQIE
ncbi:hypothetical protein HK104_001859 [Borealophlyctis nickersoniae]|nr:hypothetical protein HK104_001859 [Borealophlyctis nickersoniae]